MLPLSTLRVPRALVQHAPFVHFIPFRLVSFRSFAQYAIHSHFHIHSHWPFRKLFVWGIISTMHKSTESFIRWASGAVEQQEEHRTFLLKNVPFLPPEMHENQKLRGNESRIAFNVFVVFCSIQCPPSPSFAHFKTRFFFFFSFCVRTKLMANVKKEYTPKNNGWGFVALL